MDELKNEIEALKNRNHRVDANKAWETSYTRKVSIAILTYIVVLIFFLTTKAKDPYISALVPTLGFLLSTLSLDYLKSIWLKHFNQNKNS